MPERICLIVDDEPAIRQFLRIILERRRIQVVEAENATDALRVLQKLGCRVDLIVSDIVMPGDFSGTDLAHSVRHTFPAIPVILFSGYCQEAKDAAGFDFIPKPFVPETILSAVERALSLR
jgi:two-component system cell cycle sensor histidine kinase/response regulator CckA